MNPEIEVLEIDEKPPRISDSELQTIVKVEELKLARSKNRWAAIIICTAILGFTGMCHAVCG